MDSPEIAQRLAVLEGKIAKQESTIAQMQEAMMLLLRFIIDNQPPGNLKVMALRTALEKLHTPPRS